MRIYRKKSPRGLAGVGDSLFDDTIQAYSAAATNTASTAATDTTVTTTTTDTSTTATNTDYLKYGLWAAAAFVAWKFLL